MDEKRCEICHLSAKIICFCRKALLCERCIGKHFLDEPSLSHKPITLTQGEVTKVYEDQIVALHHNEERLLEEAQQKQEITNAAKAKISQEIDHLTMLQPEIREFIVHTKEIIGKTVSDLMEKLTFEMISRSKDHILVLEAALGHLEGKDLKPENEVVKAFGEAKTVAEIEGLKIVNCRMETGTFDIEEAIRSGVQFSIEFVKPRPKPPDVKKPVSEIPKSVQKSGIGQVRKSGSKPVEGKQSSHTKASQSFAANLAITQFDSSESVTRKRLSIGGKIENSKRKTQLSPSTTHTKKDPNVRRNTAYDITPFSLALETKTSSDPKSDEEFNLLDEEYPMPEPETKPEEPKFGLRKFATETPESLNVTVSGPVSRITELQAARTKSKQSKLKETAQKVEDVAQQVRGLKSGRSGSGSHSSLSKSMIVDPPIDREGGDHPASPETKKKHLTPKVSVTPPEGENRSLTPRRSITEEVLTPRQKLTTTISKATEVSRTLTNFVDREVEERKEIMGSPGSGRASPSFPKQTYIVQAGTKTIKVLDLDSNTTFVKEFSLSANFGRDLAWCCSLYGEVFFVGGVLDAEVMKNIAIYNPGTDELESGYMMLVARYRHSALYFQDSIYIIGGLGITHSPLRDCERFDIRRKTCKKIGNLAHARESHSACVFEGKIYVAGGPQADAVEVMAPLTETFNLLYLKVSCAGHTTMFADRDKIVILHNNQVTHLWPEDRNAKEVEKLAEYDWWCQGPAVVTEGGAYLVKQESAYRFDLEASSMKRLEGT